MKKYLIYNHTVLFNPNGISPAETVTCDTCSVSSVQYNAIVFMYANNVHSLTVDGCDIKLVG